MWHEAGSGAAARLFEEQAKRRVVVGLLLGEVIRTNSELKAADEERVKATIEIGVLLYESRKVIEVLQQNKG